jgi:hypothetical protein
LIWAVVAITDSLSSVNVESVYRVTCPVPVSR